jgi:hypothetical protein
VAKFTTLTPLSLLISCKLSFPIVGLKMEKVVSVINYDYSETENSHFHLDSNNLSELFSQAKQIILDA